MDVLRAVLDGEASLQLQRALVIHHPAHTRGTQASHQIQYHTVGRGEPHYTVIVTYTFLAYAPLY